MRTEPEWSDQLLPLLLDCFPTAERVVVTLVDDSGEPSEQCARVRAQGNQLIRPSISLDLVRKVLDSGAPLLSLDTPPDDRPGMRSPFAERPIQSVLYAPMFNRDGRPIGVIQVDAAPKEDVFTASDLEFLLTIASFVEVVIGAMDPRFDSHSKLAVLLDEHCVAQQKPKIEGFRFSQWISPCGITTGNLLDLIPLSEDRLTLIIADFIGNGLVAATKKIVLRALIRSCLGQEPDLGNAIELLNDRLCRSNFEGFATLLVIVMSRRSGDVSVINAGHQSPLVHRVDGDAKEDVSLDDESGLPLGIDEGMDYAETKLHLQCGDRIAVFTSGVSEAENLQGNAFGVEPIHQLLASSEDVDVIRDRIKDSVSNHLGTGRQQDDITLVVIQRVQDA
ncbi:PP2C family protein-serine/threonine phosphatase [Novipirellula sp. SH528]|uniref:PP2C family protein-serine/threonine phosphatase n=1 Tax=Novipirellula sp. SH528 TaxID=3454466 RepID=UPI003FA186B9